MKFIIAKKLEMTRRYNEAGEAVPVTKVAAGPCVVTQVKSPDRDGYRAVQVAFGATKESRLAKPQRGHLAAAKVEPMATTREFRADDEVSVGDRVSCATFQPGDRVSVTGTSKGKGFAGVVKRHGFHGSPASHGHKDQLRMPGSIGSSATPSRVLKGKRMGGHMGDDRVTVKNLEVIEVDAAEGAIYLRGAIPGARNGLLTISAEGELKLDAGQAEAAKPEEGKADAPAVEEAAQPEAEAEKKPEEKSEEKEQPEAEEKPEEKKEEPAEKKEGAAEAEESEAKKSE